MFLIPFSWLNAYSLFIFQLVCVCVCVCEWILIRFTWRNGYRHWFPKLLRRQSSGGYRFNPHYRRVTIQEHLYPVMANGIRTHGFNKGRCSKFREGPRVQQMPEEGQRTYELKRYGNNNKDEDNSPKTLNDKNDYYMKLFVLNSNTWNHLTVCK